MFCNKRQQYLCCSVSSCDVCLCKKCYESYDDNSIHHISFPFNGDNNGDDNSDGDGDGHSDINVSDDDSDGILEEPYDSDDEATVGGDYLFTQPAARDNSNNDLEDCLGMCDPPDIEVGDISEDDESQNSFEIGVIDGYEDDGIEVCPTTNAANEHIEIRAETAYGGRNNDFIISGSGLLCETTSI